MQRIIDWCLKNPLIVLTLALVLLVVSIYSLTRLKLDAIPDLSDTQVIVRANFQGQPPQVVEDQVTYPLTTRMLSVPSAKSVRGYSFFGFSLVYILFEDGTDIYWARSRVLEYLNTLRGQLPTAVNLELGPDATSIGWIYQYALIDKSGQLSLADLRDLQDFSIRYELTSVKGVSEVASVGGFKRQFQLEVNPKLLLQYNISLSEIERAIQKGNMEMGARLFQQAEVEYMVLALGYLTSIEEIKEIPIRMTTAGGVLRLGDIAQVKEGPDIRRGLVDLDGKGEVVGGIVLMRQGEDALSTIENIKQKLDDLQNFLPEGVAFVTVYDRSILIHKAIANLVQKLIEEMAIVSLITVLFLLHVRSIFIALIILPFGILLSLLSLYLLDLPANIMSLGGLAIAIGVMVDASLVMVENAHRHIAVMQEKLGVSRLSKRDSLRASRQAVLQVAPGLFWSMIIILISFLPVFALPEQSGRLFIPLALTKTLAIGFAALLALFLIPVLISYLIRGTAQKQSSNMINLFLTRYYKNALQWALDHKLSVLAISLSLLLFSLLPLCGIPNPFSNRKLLPGIGSEFMPPLEEGDILYMPTTIPGISISKAKEILTKTNKMIKEVPEVKQVFGKIGRADTATDPAPLSMIESVIILKDRDEWRDGMTFDKIIAELDQKARLPGLVNAWTMPIKARIDMLSTGIRTPIGVKVMGDDLAKLQQLTKVLESHIRNVQGVSSVFGERAEGGNYIIYKVDRYRAGLYGLNVADIQTILARAIGGIRVTEIISGPNRWSANIRYFRSFRESLEDLKNVYIPLPGGAGQIPISEVAEFKIEKGPATIKTENGRKTSWLYVDTRKSDIGSIVEEIKSKIDKLIKSGQISWPAGYSYIFSGQYEQMQLATDRMKILIPLVFLSIFIILFFYFKNFHYPLWVIFGSFLFAPLGGIWCMYLLEYNRSVASDVGFIALIGLAAETGIIMLVYLRAAINDWLPKQKRKDLPMEDKISSLRELIQASASQRIRPVMMTALTDMLALLPLFWGSEPGNAAMRRIAIPLVGGSVTSLLVTLILIPLLFDWWWARRIRRDMS